MKIPLSRYAGLPTEQQNPRTQNIDRIALVDVVRAINREDTSVPAMVAKASVQIAKAAALAAKAYGGGKKIIFIGAGTSGRMGVLEAAECPPTFGVTPNQVTAIMAGGKSSVFRAKEGAEDDAEAGDKDLLKKARRGDCVIGIAASGVTPYVMSALKEAKKIGCSTVFVTCSAKAARVKADAVVVVSTGPEVLSGSTRMKAGTATKLILNAITTAAMIACGKAYKNWMVDVRPTSRKLVARATRLAAGLGGIHPAKAAELLRQTNYNVKAVIVMAKTGATKKQALEMLRKHRGFLKDIIE